MAHHELGSSNPTSRWNREQKPRIEIEPGDTVTLNMLDASGGQVNPGMTLEEFGAIDRNQVHALNGPIAVKGAEPGDVLRVDILEVEHCGWAWTSIEPGKGLLERLNDERFLFFWELEGNQTRSMPGTVLELAPFCGVMGVQREAFGEYRTAVPGRFGGNMDVKHLIAGTSLYLPVFVEGAGFCAGDSHAAQGDGEVAISGMEAPMKGKFRFTIERGLSLCSPRASVPRTALSPAYQKKPWMAFIESDQDPRTACRQVVEQAISYLVDRIGVDEKQAYVLCSVVLDLKISQLVNTPVTTVTGFLPEAIFTD